jgi:hypothetical protein
MQNIKSKRKQDNISPREVRKHQVQIMLNDSELAVVDSVKSGLRRAEVVRMLINGNLPAPIPELNALAWTELSKSAANLNQIAHHLNAGESLEIEKIRAELEGFRAALLGASI